LAAVSGTSFAQSSVTISGTAKAGFSNMKYSNGGVATTNGTSQALADGSSQFHIKGIEDLGGGLKAEFQIDTRFRFDDNGGAGALPTGAVASQVATGNTWLGLTGGFGTIRAGKMDTHYCLGADEHGSRATSLAASSCSLLGYVGGGANSIANASRSTNMFRYISPVMSGLTLQANYSTSWAGTEGGLNVGLPNVAGNDGKGNAMNLRADYANGPLTAGLSYWNAKGEDQQATVARTGQRANTIAVGYNLGVAKIGLTYDVSAVRAAAANVAAFTDTKRTAYSIPVVVPMGAGAVLFTYTSAGNSKTAGTTNVDTSATMVSVGYDHSLSKRTSLGVSYAKVDNKANAAYNPFVYSALTGSGAVGAGQDTAQLYLGLRHTF
jgi:predicted porin